MHFRTRLSAALLLLAGCNFLLSACGNRGPLTLPPKDSSSAAAAKPPPDHSNTAPSIPGKQ